jgi:hypothetical protein
MIRVLAYDVMGQIHVTAVDIWRDEDGATHSTDLGSVTCSLGGIDPADSRDCLALVGEVLCDMAYDDHGTISFLSR